MILIMGSALVPQICPTMRPPRLTVAFVFVFTLKLRTLSSYQLYQPLGPPTAIALVRPLPFAGRPSGRYLAVALMRLTS